MPACAGLAVAADAAAGEDGCFAGVSEAELVGVLGAWDRLEAHDGRPQAGRHRRAGPPQPQAARGGDEFTADELAAALAESRAAAGDLLDLAQT